MTPVTVQRGDGPLVLGMPHGGTHVPGDVWTALNATGRALADTDWHIAQLYEGLASAATIVRAHMHRYVIDANRDPGGSSLYPGQNTTTLVPLTDFDGQGIWDTPPTPADIATRAARYHAPYHAALQSELERVRQRHGVVILFECHSIRSRIPFLFDGELPQFSIGTGGGTTCDPRVTQALAEVCSAAVGYDSVIDGRFRGGWTTRHYGHPAEGFHAIQLELAQRGYLTDEAPPWAFDAAAADRLRPHLRSALRALAALAPTLGGAS